PSGSPRALPSFPTRRSSDLLDGRQQDVLLGLGEAVDLVEKEDRGLVVLVASLLRGGENLADLLDGGRGRRELDKPLVRASSDDIGDRRLAGARRPPEEDRGLRGAFDDAFQRRAREDHVILPDELIEHGRPHARGQWLMRGQGSVLLLTIRVLFPGAPVGDRFKGVRRTEHVAVLLKEPVGLDASPGVRRDLLFVLWV